MSKMRPMTTGKRHGLWLRGGPPPPPVVIEQSLLGSIPVALVELILAYSSTSRGGSSSSS
eukprot:1293068-Prymnesium_polylepis.1